MMKVRTWDGQTDYHPEKYAAEMASVRSECAEELAAAREQIHFSMVEAKMQLKFN